MTLGHLNTNKTWTKSLRDLQVELSRWGIEDYVLPTFRECRASGEVSLQMARHGVWIYPRCRRFPTPEQNLRAIVLAVEGVRKAEQRGIGELFAEVAKLLALPSGESDPYTVLGVSKGESDQSKLRTAYNARLFKVHPDHGGSSEAFHELQEAAKALGII